MQKPTIIPLATIKSEISELCKVIHCSKSYDEFKQREARLSYLGELLKQFPKSSRRMRS